MYRSGPGLGSDLFVHSRQQRGWHCGYARHAAQRKLPSTTGTETAYPRIKVLISIEGNADAFVQAAQPQNRNAFVASCIQQFIQGRIADGVEAPSLFDGIDVDWEYPMEADKLNFLALLAEFSQPT